MNIILGGLSNKSYVSEENSKLKICTVYKFIIISALVAYEITY